MIMLVTCNMYWHALYYQTNFYFLNTFILFSFYFSYFFLFFLFFLYLVTKYSLALEYAGVELQSLTNCKLDGNLNYLRDLSIVS